MTPSSSVIEKIAKLQADIRAEMFAVSKRKQETSSAYPIHLAIGHERLAATCSTIAASNDRFVLTHRNIHFNLALTPQSLWHKISNEAMALEDGINKGAYGCMTMRGSERISYVSSILGNNLSVGLGVASTLPKENVCWIQTGDGSIEEGAFHEALVFSNARKLRCIFLVENNNWSLGTSIAERRQPICLESIAKAHGISYFDIALDASAEKYFEVLDNAMTTCTGPMIIEIHLKTEGGLNHPERNYVSYHHGSISK